MSTRLELFGKKTAKSKYVSSNVIAEGKQVMPLIWFTLFSPDDLTAIPAEDFSKLDLTTSTESALKRLPENAETLEKLVGSKGECTYAANLLGEAIVGSGHRFLSVELMDMQLNYDDPDDFQSQLTSAFNELKNRKRFNSLEGLSAVDDHKSIKLSKSATTEDDWTMKDWIALDLLLGYPAVQKSRWHKLVLAASKKHRK